MKVFVLNMRGQPLMPCSPAKARHLLKAEKAVVKRRTPFTIQLRIATGETKQNVTLGVDAGAKHVGLSATTEKEEVFASEVPPAHGRGRDRLLTHENPPGAPAPDPIQSFGPNFLPENAGRAVSGGNAGAGP